jgi:hypothetical protein
MLEAADTRLAFVLIILLGLVKRPSIAGIAQFESAQEDVQMATARILVQVHPVRLFPLAPAATSKRLTSSFFLPGSGRLRHLLYDLILSGPGHQPP